MGKIPLIHWFNNIFRESTLERENACILNEGLSSIYNGFHWNADNSLKITRNI